MTGYITFKVAMHTPCAVLLGSTVQLLLELFYLLRGLMWGKD